MRFISALLAALLILGAVSCYSPAQSTPPPGTRVKLFVDRSGLYEVPAQALAARGIDLGHTDGSDLSLSTGGTPVPFQLAGDGSERSLRFYGQILDSSAYLARNVYWLQHASPGGPQVAVSTPQLPAVAAPSTAVTFTLHLEEQLSYALQRGAGEDPWLWQNLIAPAEFAAPFEAPEVAAGTVMLRLSVRDGSMGTTRPAHHLVLTLNGQEVGEARWAAPGEHKIDVPVPAGVLHSGENGLRLSLPADTGAPFETLWLDWAEVGYSRSISLEKGQLSFLTQGSTLVLRAPDGLAAAWDITDPAQPVALDAAAQGASPQSGQASISGGAGRRLLVAAPGGLLRPVLGAEDAGAGRELEDWPGGADLIVVTAPRFRQALAPLVSERRQEGLRVAVVDVAALFDHFTYGRSDPEAIRALVQRALGHWAGPPPRYLLLAGDASYDPAGYLHGAESDIVPTRLVSTTFTGWTASDVSYALPPGGQGVPALSVGRLPAQTAGQLAAMVAKTLAYERSAANQDWAWQGLVVADGSDAGFGSAARAFAASLPNYSMQVIATGSDGSAARALLLQRLDGGVGLLAYFGHGSLNLWSSQPVFSAQDVSALKNNRLPIVFTLTCLSGFFQHPSAVSLGEALLRAPGGGAVAALMPSTAGLLEDQRPIAEGLAAGLAGNAGRRVALGDVVLEVQQHYLADHPGLSETLLTFNLLGDPTLRLTPPGR
jgi:hypothetical protein